jgi:hypothetical protein
VEVFTALTSFINPSPARGEGIHRSATGVNRKLVPATRQDAFDIFEKNVPSPLAGEGQGEGEPITCERSEHLNSSLKTQNSKLKTAIGY